MSYYFEYLKILQYLRKQMYSMKKHMKDISYTIFIIILYKRDMISIVQYF